MENILISFSFLSLTNFRTQFGVMQCVHYVRSRDCAHALAYHQNREKAVVCKWTMKPKQFSESKLMCVCVFVSVRENFCFFILGYELAIDQIVPSLSFDWQHSQHLLKLFLVPHVSHPLFLTSFFSLPLQRSITATCSSQVLSLICLAVYV